MPYSIKCFLEIRKKTWKRSCWCWRYLSGILRLKICSVVLRPGLKPACSSPVIVSAWGFNLFSKIFNITFLAWLIRLIVRWFWHCCRLPFFGRVITSDWVQQGGHSPVCQILLQMLRSASVMVSPPAWSSSVGVLSTPQLFPDLSDFTAASTSSRRMR